MIRIKSRTSILLVLFLLILFLILILILLLLPLFEKNDSEPLGSEIIRRSHKPRRSAV